MIVLKTDGEWAYGDMSATSPHCSFQLVIDQPGLYKIWTSCLGGWVKVNGFAEGIQQLTTYLLRNTYTVTVNWGGQASFRICCRKKG